MAEIDRIIMENLRQGIFLLEHGERKGAYNVIEKGLKRLEVVINDES